MSGKCESGLRVPDGNILPNEENAEVLAVEIDFLGVVSMLPDSRTW